MSSARIPFDPCAACSGEGVTRLIVDERNTSIKKGCTRCDGTGADRVIQLRGGESLVVLTANGRIFSRDAAQRGKDFVMVWEEIEV